MNTRFFSEDSFWNTPIEKGAEIDPKSDYYISLLERDKYGAFGINVHQWTIPVYEANSNTPRVSVSKRHHPEEELQKRGSKWLGAGDRFSHGPGFGENVPMPEKVLPDPEGDAHFAVIDLSAGLAWDMWGAVKKADGSWESNTGMVYDINGSGVLNREDFDVRDGESIHFHGPSRAAGVSAIAGLIMHHEVIGGEISHKLACATAFNAHKEFVFPPAIWTDGYLDGGLPEGAVMQLDPELELTQFDLLPGEMAVARALQIYGMVNVDNSDGNSLYAEGLWDKDGIDWDGLLTPLGLQKIPLKHYHILKIGETVKMGDSKRKGVGN